MVGIWGVHSGAGATTMAVALANYMRGFLNKRTALYECNSKADFIKIYESIYGDDLMLTEGCFEYKKVEYFLKNGLDIVRAADGVHDVIIIDFGSGLGVISEFVRCHHKIVISSLEPWYAKKYELFCEKLSEYQGSDRWLHVLGGSQRAIRSFKRKYDVVVMSRPNIEDAYAIDKNLIHFFSYLFD